MGELEQGILGSNDYDLEVDIEGPVFDVNSGRDDVRDVLEYGKQGGMHVEVIDEYARLATILIEGECSEVFDIEGLVLQEHLTSSGCLT